MHDASFIPSDQTNRLLSTIASKKIGLPRRHSDSSGEFNQNLITGIVTLGIVDLFEMVDVDHQYLQLLFLPFCASSFQVDHLKKGSPVVARSSNSRSATFRSVISRLTST
ncbi:MAG: hypothetical protein ACJAX5_002514 [Patiriisocius sp.]